MSFQTGCYRKSPGLRVRALPELDTCLAYVPRPPRLCRLNLAAWLILELCERGSAADLRDAYCDAVGDSTDRTYSMAKLEEGLSELVELGVLQRIEPDGNERGDER